MIGKRIAAIALVSLMALSPAALASGVKPGDKKPEKPQSITIQTVAHINFPSAMAPGQASFSNPEDAASSVVYALRISVAELERQAGITGYTEADYAERAAQDGFDPANDYLILCQTEPIAPGESIEEITLGALPSGETLPVGTYKSQLLMMPVEDGSADVAGAAQEGDTFTLQPQINLSASIDVPFTIQSETIILTADADGQISLKVFNPADAKGDAIYSIQISQGEIERISGSPHRTPEQLAIQQADPEFMADYEFLSLFESAPVAPGQFLSEAAVRQLPDGERLPAGTYQAWLVKYETDKETGERTMDSVNTEIQLTVQ